jgi:phage pi2 protein 07
MNWTREEFEQDKQRYQRELDELLAEGFTEEDFRVRRQRRRIETVDRVLTDPRYGLTEEA